MTELEDKEIVHFSITYSLDRDGFFRRTCPNCGRDFKTKSDPSDITSVLQPAFKRIEKEIGEISLPITDTESNPQYLSCPYCNHHAESGDMITKDFSVYLKRLIMREYVLPKIKNMLSDFAQGLKSTSKSNSFISFEINADFDSNLPPRLISGPEPPDMTKVEMLCCGKEIKILDGWFELEKCPYCGTDVRII